MKYLLSTLVVFIFFFSTLSLPAQADEKPSVSLSDAVYADLALRHYLGNISISSIENQPKDQISINATKQWLPASTVKLYVAMYAYDQINKGNFSYNDSFYIEGKNVVPTE